MLRRILVPLDGSAFAEGALPVAIAIAQKTGGELHLLSVVDSMEAPAAAMHEWARAGEYLEVVTRRVGQLWEGPIHTSLRKGTVERELAALVLGWRADLIVMSTHGRSGVSRLWMGSIAERCVRSGFCPTLLVRPQETESANLDELPAPSRIVLPLDGSEVAERAIPFGVELSKVFAVPALLLRVLNQPRGVELALNPEAIDVVRKLRYQDRLDAKEYLQSQVDRLRKAGVQAYSVLVNELGPAEAIVARDDGDWVVISTNGFGGVDRALFGSVADKVVRSSKHPLLVISKVTGWAASDSSESPVHAAAGS